MTLGRMTLVNVGASQARCFFQDCGCGLGFHVLPGSCVTTAGASGYKQDPLRHMYPPHKDHVWRFPPPGVLCSPKLNP